MTFRTDEKQTRTQTPTIANSSSKAKPAPPVRRRTRAKPKASSTPESAFGGAKAGGPRPGSKAAKVLALLKRPQGVGLKELLRVTGWQPHSVRGFLSGIVTRKMGLKVKSIKAESGERRYAVKA